MMHDFARRVSNREVLAGVGRRRDSLVALTVVVKQLREVVTVRATSGENGDGVTTHTAHITRHIDTSSTGYQCRLNAS